MISDKSIWECCGRNFCSYKVKFEETILCSNVFNVNGICSFVSCPLANSLYSTIIEQDGVCYLYLKSPERVFTPSKMWEIIKLPPNINKAFEIIDKRMTNVYKEYQIVRCKKRLCKILENLQRIRKHELQVDTELVTEKQKLRRREAAREVKALRAAKIQTTLESTLLERLKNGYYGEIYNSNVEQFNETLKQGTYEIPNDPELLEERDETESKIAN